MASAFLSLPPPWSFGSADLKANAGRFLRRALVVSALVHLAAVGVFRAALERFAATDEEIPAVIGPWTPPVVVIPHLDPTQWTQPTGSHSTSGVITPREKEVIFPTIDRGGPDASHDPVGEGPLVPPTGPGPAPAPPGPAEQSFIPVPDTPPVPLVAPRPPYPTWAKEAGIEGKVVVSVLVGTDGIPKKVVVVSGPKGLTEGIEGPLLRWRFSPGLSNRTPVECWVEIPISFKLSG